MEEGEVAKFPRPDDDIPEEQCSSPEAYPSPDAGDGKGTERLRMLVSGTVTQVLLIHI